MDVPEQISIQVTFCSWIFLLSCRKDSDGNIANFVYNLTSEFPINVTCRNLPVCVVLFIHWLRLDDIHPVFNGLHRLTGPIPIVTDSCTGRLDNRPALTACE